MWAKLTDDWDQLSTDLQSIQAAKLAAILLQVQPVFQQPRSHRANKHFFKSTVIIKVQMFPCWLETTLGAA